MAPHGRRSEAVCPPPTPQEECRGWDVNEVVFSGAMWGTYQPLLRADFTLFDEYNFTRQGAPTSLPCGLRPPTNAPPATLCKTARSPPLPRPAQAPERCACSTSAAPIRNESPFAMKDPWNTCSTSGLDEPALYCLFCTAWSTIAATSCRLLLGGDAGEPPFDLPIHAFFGTKDKRIKETMVQVHHAHPLPA